MLTPRAKRELMLFMYINTFVHWRYFCIFRRGIFSFVGKFDRDIYICREIIRTHSIQQKSTEYAVGKVIFISSVYKNDARSTKQMDGIYSNNE